MLETSETYHTIQFDFESLLFRTILFEAPMVCSHSEYQGGRHRFWFNQLVQADANMPWASVQHEEDAQIGIVLQPQTLTRHQNRPGRAQRGLLWTCLADTNVKGERTWPVGRHFFRNAPQQSWASRMWRNFKISRSTPRPLFKHTRRCQDY